MGENRYAECWLDCKVEGGEKDGVAAEAANSGSFEPLLKKLLAAVMAKARRNGAARSSIHFGEESDKLWVTLGWRCRPAAWGIFFDTRDNTI